jgi:hypothetical protein
MQRFQIPRRRKGRRDDVILAHMKTHVSELLGAAPSAFQGAIGQNPDHDPLSAQ